MNFSMNSMKKLLISLLILSFTILPLGAEIEWQRRDFFDFTGGLNDGFSDTNIQDNEASSLQNVIFTTGGDVKTRGGSKKLNSTLVSGTAAIGTGITFYKKSDGTKFLVSLWDNDHIQKMDYNIGGGPNGTWEAITGTFSADISQNDLASFTIGQDVLIIEDGIGSTPPLKWTGSDVLPSDHVKNLGGSPPNAKFVAFHKNMAFAAGDDDNPSLLSFTDVGDIENWTTGLSGNVAVETNDGSIIRAIVPGFDALYIWKDTSIWRLSGSDKDTFVLQRVVSDIGTKSGVSIVRIGNQFIFVSDDGDIFLYDGAVKVRKISSKIEGTTGNFNFSRLFYTPAVKFDEDYLLAFTNTGASQNDRVVLFDSFHLNWTKFVGLKANAMAVAEGDTGEDIVVFVDYGGFAYEYPSGTNDAGIALSGTYQTKQFRFPDMTPKKTLKLVRLFLNQEGDYNLIVEVRGDFETTGTSTNVNLRGESSIYGVAIYGIDRYAGQNVIIHRIEPDKGDNFLQLKFSNTLLDEPWQLKGYQLFLEKSDEI